MCSGPGRNMFRRRADADYPGVHGHRDFKTTLIYADYAPSEHELNLVNAAWPNSTDPVVYPTVYQTESNSEHLGSTNPVGTGVIAAQSSEDH